MFTIAHAYARLDKVWPWNENAYPVLRRLDAPASALAFKLHHALGHLHKSVGKIEAAVEPVDHGAEAVGLAGAEMTELVGKSVVDLLRLAKDAGVTAEDLEAYLETVFRRGAA